jgi:hypothetical protein
VELDWSLLGLTMIQLFAVKERIALGEPPQSSSVALAIRIIREMMDRRLEPSEPGEDLRTRLQEATTDPYQRKRPKQARYRPAYKDKPSAGKPKIIKAQRKHKRFLQQYLEQAA